MTQSTEQAADTQPCVDCQSPVNSDVWDEELGFCLDYSNDYWDHTGRYAD